MSKEDDLQKEIEDKKILNQTDKIIKNMANQKMNRHVKEKNEPVFDEILSSFNEKYANGVASKSVIEILKFVKNEF